MGSGILVSGQGAMRTEDLIGSLASGLTPVRRMRAPGTQALLWLGAAAGVIALAVLLHGLRPDLAEILMLPQGGWQFLASMATGITAAFAAAMLARADRPARWAWLPVPFLLVWLSLLGLGCIEDLARMGEAAMHPTLSTGCIQFIGMLGVPLAAGLLLLLRHAGPVRPTPVLLLGALASAALCSAGLSLFHHLDAALEVLISYGLAVLLVIGLARVFGTAILMRPASPV